MDKEQDKAVALAEEHGAVRDARLSQEWDMPVWAASEEVFAAMLAERDQQHTAELAQRSGKMPKSWRGVPGTRLCLAEEVREAIAAMQAQIEQAQHAYAHDTSALLADIEQARARVVELEAKLIECRSSVKNDANNFDRFMLRKEPNANQCDYDEQKRLHELRDWIDALIVQRDAAMKKSTFNHG